MSLRAGIDIGAHTIKLWLDDGDGGRGRLLRGGLLFEGETVRLWQRSPFTSATGVFADPATAPWRDGEYKVWSAPALLGLSLRAAIAAAAPQAGVEGVRAAITGAADLTLPQRADLLLASRYAGFDEAAFIDPWTALARGLEAGPDQAGALVADLGHRALRLAMVRAGESGLDVSQSWLLPGLGGARLDREAARAAAARLGLPDQPDLVTRLRDRLLAALCDTDARSHDPSARGTWLDLEDRWVSLALGAHSLDLLYGEALREAAADVVLPPTSPPPPTRLTGLAPRLPAIARGLSRMLGEPDAVSAPCDPFAAARGALRSLEGRPPPVSVRPIGEGLGMMARGTDGAVLVRPLLAAGDDAPREARESVRVQRAGQEVMTFDLVSLSGGADAPAWRQRFGFRLGEGRQAGDALEMAVHYESNDRLTVTLRDPVGRLAASQSRDLVAALAQDAFNGEQARLVSSAVIGRAGPNVLD